MVGVALGHLAKAKRATMEHNEKYHNLKGPMNHSPPPPRSHVSKKLSWASPRWRRPADPRLKAKGSKGPD